MRMLCLLSCAALSLPGPVEACDLALAFALDVSGSVDQREFILQREGLAAALVDPRTVAAIKDQPGGVAMMVYEWSGAHQQTQIAEWRRVTGADDLAALAADVLAPPRSAEGATAIGAAIGFGALMIDYGTDCLRQVIDVSGDGIHNNGYRPHVTWGWPVMEDVTVNALVIEGAEPEVLAYYVTHVIGGPGAFVEIAAGFEDYADAMRRKLMRELAAPVARREN